MCALNLAESAGVVVDYAVGGAMAVLTPSSLLHDLHCAGLLEREEVHLQRLRANRRVLDRHRVCDVPDRLRQSERPDPDPV